ncbi:patatin-like phospholipase family protein [Nitrospira defluvii]|nr:patatin-like phospholipase family protein [Nitrospira defluvii]
MKIGLALGGGGARGIAHIGVLQVLEQEGIQIDRISGTSFGSIVGAIYAQNPNAKMLEKRVIKFLNSEQFRRTKIFFIKRHFEEKKNKGFFTSIKSYLQKGIFWGISLQKTSFISEENFLSQFTELLDDHQIEDTVIPFSAVATDITNGKEIVLSKGPIRRLVSASCAIPGVFPPIHIDHLQLIDGGWVNQIPVSSLRKRGVEFIIAVDISSDETSDPKTFSSGLDIVLRANEITRTTLTHIQTENADYIIRPQLEKIHWSDFWRYDEAIQKGKEAAMASIEPLKRMLWKNRVKRFLKFGH